GRRMDGGGALILRRLRLGLDERDRDAFLDQRERRHRPHGAGADHDHPIIALHHPLQRIRLYTPIRLIGSVSSPRKRGPIFQGRWLWVVPAYGVPATRASRGAPRGDDSQSRYQTFEISNIEGWNNSSAVTLRSIKPCSWAYCVNAVISRMFFAMP